MKVEIDQSKCIGCGACVAISKENFDFNEDGLSTVIDNTVYDSTRDAVEACPVYAISILESEGCNENCKCKHCKDECEEKEAA